MDQVIAPVTKLIVVPVKEHIVQRIKNAIHFEDNFKEVKEGLEYLEAKRIDIQREMEEDKISSMPNEECKHWLGKVDEIMKKVKDMIDQINDLKEKYRHKRCFSLCHGVGYRMKLGNKLVRLISSIKECKDKKIFPPAPVDETSPHQKMQEILSYIRDKETYKIGVWGPGGVGKTTIIQNLNNLPELGDNFDIIIWVKVARDSVIRIRNNISRQLMLNVERETDSTIINKLFKKLETMKFLLLLDDVWEFLKLEDLGVPSTNPDMKGSKVVLITKNERVCDRMGTSKKVHVDYLKEKEAWELFCREADLERETDSNQDMVRLARDVAKDCDGLPLAIIVVGAAMRGKKEIYEWQSALCGLQSQDSSRIEDMEEKVFKTLRWCYDCLPNEETKKCFMYFALFPEDYEIESHQLINYWWNEGHIVSKGEIVEDIEKARNDGHVILKNLLDASLLQQTRSNHIKMHDLLRDLTLIVANDEGHNFIVKHGNEVKELKDLEWEKGQKISFVSCGTTSLPHEPKCPVLTTLLLQLNEGLRKIPDLFFSQMTSLQVLDLSGTNIELLPASLDTLANLRTLYLVDTRLKDLPHRPKLPKLSSLFLERNPGLETIPDLFFSQMRSLQVLDLSGTKIESLPISLDSLVNLRELYLVGTCLKALPHRPKLLNLSSLFLKGNLWLGTIPDSFFEQMPALTILDLSDTHIRVLPLSISCIKRLQIFVLSCRDLKDLPLDMGKLDNLVDLDLGGPFGGLYGGPSRKIPSGVLSELKKLKRLIIDPGSWLVEEGVTKELASLENVTELTCPLLANDFEYFIDHSQPWKQGTLNSFGLHVFGSRPLFGTYDQAPTQRHISFSSCNGLNDLNFSSGCMTKLESLIVEECSETKIFISENRVFGSVTNTDDTFQHLKTLKFNGMRDLKSFYQGPGSLSHVKLRSLRILVFSRCPVLKELLSLALLQQLTSLEELTVKECYKIEEIIKDDEGGEDGVVKQKQVEIVKLKRLELQSLPSLFSICPEHVSIVCRSLQSIIVTNCRNLKCLPL